MSDLFVSARDMRGNLGRNSSRDMREETIGEYEVIVSVGYDQSWINHIQVKYVATAI